MASALSTTDNSYSSTKGLKRLSLTPGVSLATRRHSSQNSTTTLHDSNIDTTAQPTPVPSHGKRMAPKRMSTISYYTPSSPSVAPIVRSPPPSIIPESCEDTPRPLDGLQRSASFPRRQFHERLRTNDDASGLSPKAPPILTLADKHADLLSFIAQKESKCLELRDQLAQHEAELQSLKRKWERIVARSTSSTSLSRASTSLPSSPEDSFLPLPTSKTEPPGTATSDGVVEVVGAIRDGVQGLGRMLMMGGLAPSTNPSYSTKLSSDLPNKAYSTRASTVFNSRTSSLSSITVTSPSSQSTDRTSFSSLTSASSDAEEDEDKPEAFSVGASDDGGHTPTLSMKNEEPPFHAPAVDREDVTTIMARRSSSRSPSGPRTTIGHSEHKTTAPEKGEKDLGSLEGRDLSRRLSHKTHLHLASTSQPAASSWVPINLNKKWEDLQKTETFTKSSKRASILLSDMTSVSTSLLGTLSSALSPSSPAPPYLKHAHPQQQQQRRRRSSSSAPSPISPPTYFPLVSLNSPTLGQGPSSRTTSTSILDEADEEVTNIDVSGNHPPLPPGSLSLGAVLIPTPRPPSSPALPSEGNKVGSDDDESWNW